MGGTEEPRELSVDQLPDQVSGDGKLIGVHGHGGRRPG
jgi:hypothetical protein